MSALKLIVTEGRLNTKSNKRCTHTYKPTYGHNTVLDGAGQRLRRRQSQIMLNANTLALAVRGACIRVQAFSLILMNWPSLLIYFVSMYHSLVDCLRDFRFHCCFGSRKLGKVCRDKPWMFEILGGLSVWRGLGIGFEIADNWSFGMKTRWHAKNVLEIVSDHSCCVRSGLIMHTNEVWAYQLCIRQYMRLQTLAYITVSI